MFKQWLETEEKWIQGILPFGKVSPEQAEKMKLVGPVYHGTTQSNHAEINIRGFDIYVGHPNQGKLSGYELKHYALGRPAPVHHLGFGVYFTFNKTRATKIYNRGTSVGLKPYYIDANPIETINFGVADKMMKWWIKIFWIYQVLFQRQ
jgi:hypothetical protein